MNRRNFLLRSAMAVFGFSILPGAGRIWKAERTLEIVTDFRPITAITCGDFNKLLFSSADRIYPSLWDIAAVPEGVAQLTPEILKKRMMVFETPGFI